MKYVFAIAALLLLAVGCMGPEPGISPPPLPDSIQAASGEVSTGSIGGFSIAFLVVGLTELVVYLSGNRIDGRNKVALAVGIGAVLLTVNEMMTAGLLPDGAVQAVLIMVNVVGKSLAIPGAVGLAKRIFSR